MQLILCYYNRYSYLKVGDLSLEDIVNNYKGYGLPCFETIRRSRQRVQSLFPELSRQCSGCDSSIRVVIEMNKEDRKMSKPTFQQKTKLMAKLFDSGCNTEKKLQQLDMESILKIPGYHDTGYGTHHRTQKETKANKLFS